jgi:hypothetical protein
MYAIINNQFSLKGKNVLMGNLFSFEFFKDSIEIEFMLLKNYPSIQAVIGFFELIKIFLID